MSTQQLVPKELLAQGWGAVGAGELPEVGHFLLASIPTPPLGGISVPIFQIRHSEKGKDLPTCPIATGDEGGGGI